MTSKRLNPATAQCLADLPVTLAQAKPCRRNGQSDPLPISTSGDHMNMTLDEAIRWTRANSHPEARSRLRSRSVAWILYMEILSLRNRITTLENGK